MVNNLEQVRAAFPWCEWSTCEDGHLYGRGGKRGDLTICDFDGWGWMFECDMGITNSERDFATLRECLADLKSQPF